MSMQVPKERKQKMATKDDKKAKVEKKEKTNEELAKEIQKKMQEKADEEGCVFC